MSTCCYRERVSRRCVSIEEKERFRWDGDTCTYGIELPKSPSTFHHVSGRPVKGSDKGRDTSIVIVQQRSRPGRRVRVRASDDAQEHKAVPEQQGSKGTNKLNAVRTTGCFRSEGMYISAYTACSVH